MLQTTEETELTMPSDFRWHSFLVSAGYLPDTEKYSHLNGILTYKEPFAVIVEIDDSKIKINGVEGEYQSVTPEDIGLDNYQWNGVSILPKASSWEINLLR